jgi:hypothetical protein
MEFYGLGDEVRGRSHAVMSERSEDPDRSVGASRAGSNSKKTCRTAKIFKPTPSPSTTNLPCSLAPP